MPDQDKIQQSLYDFDATIKAKPNLTDKELMSKFPEFGNDISKLQSAKDYSATLNSGKYKDVSEFNVKFPEFFSDVKKKESTPLQSLGGSLLSKVPKENTNILSDVSLQGVTNALPNSGRQVNEVVDLHRGIKPTIDKVALKESAEKIPNFKEAVDNAVIERNKKFGVNSKFDMNFGRADIEKQIKDGDLVPIKNSKGESKLVQGTGVLESFANAVNDKFEKDATDTYWANASKEDRIKHLNYKLNNPQEVEHEASGIPAKISQFVGENINMLGKGAVAGMGATALALPSGGASLAQFLSMLPEMAQGSYVNGLEKNYIGLKKQHPEMSDEEAYDKANKAGLLSEAMGIATDAALSGSISKNLLGKVPKPSIDVKGVFDGIVNSAKHAVTSFPKVGGVSVAGSVINDLASNAIGNKVEGDEVSKNALESAKQMAAMHFGLWALSEPMKIPSYIRPQVENLVASAPRDEVQQFYEDAEKKGVVPEGITQKVLSKLSEFDEQKAIVDKMPLSEEQKAAMTGKLLQRKNISEENSELKKYGASFNDKIEYNDAKIEQLDKETNGIAKSKDVFKHETDTRLGTPAKVENEPIQEQSTEVLQPTKIEKPTIEEVSEVKPTTEIAKTEIEGLVSVDENEIIKKMKPFTDEMVSIEREFSNKGYEINTDYDNEIQVLDKNGEQVDPQDLPKELRTLAANYEKATSKLGEFDEKSLQKAIKQSREITETKAEVIEQQPIKEEIELLDNYEVNDVIIPNDIEKEPDWQTKLVDKAFSDMGLLPSKKIAGTGTIYYTFKDKNGEDVVVRLGNHSKGRWAGREVDANVVYDENSTPQEVLDILRDKLPDGKIVKNKETKPTIKEEVKVETPTIEKQTPKEQSKLTESKKQPTDEGLRRAEAKKIHARVAAMEAPVNDARQIALRYIADGGKVSEKAINEVSGTVKRAKLNTGERELKSAEAKSRDYYQKEGETLDELAHRLWEKSDQEVSERDIKDALMEVIREHNTRLEAGKAYLEQYNTEYAEEQHYARLAEERAEEFDKELKDIENWLQSEGEKTHPIEAEEEHINNLIKQYEAEFKAENQQPTTTSEGKVTETPSSRTSGEEIETKEIEEKAIDLSKVPQTKLKAVKPPTKPPSEGDVLMQEPNKKKREFGVKQHLMSAEEIPANFKKGIEESGLEYEVTSPEEAQKAARGIVDTMGRDNALRLASEGALHPSVGSAVFTTSLNDIWAEERSSKEKGDNNRANELAQEFITTQDELARISNSGGKWNAQLAHSYKQSPMAFVMRTNTERAEQFKEWLKNNINEADLKAVHEEILNSEKAKLLINEKVEALRREERKEERKKNYKKIDDFFEKAKMKGGSYATLIPPPIWNAAMDIMNAATKGGYLAVDAVRLAIEHIDKELKGKDWDKDRFRKEYEELLGKVADSGTKSEKSTIKSLEDRKNELQRRIDEKDFSSEEYKEKKTLNEKEKAAQKEYDEVKEAYDEAKKESPEYKDKKAKQYIEQFRKRLGKLSNEQKDDIIRRSIKDLIKNKALSYDDFKKIIADVMGVKELTEEEIKHIESLTDDINAVEGAEKTMVDNPTKENIAAFEKAKDKGQDANQKIYDITHKDSDITGTLRSMLNGNFLSIFSVTKNPLQNVVYQVTVRFPRALVKAGIDYSLAKVGVDINTADLVAANKWYFKQGKKSLSTAIKNFKTGVQEQDITSKYTYRSNLAPKEAAKDLKLWKEGNKFLTKQEVIDRYIRSSIFSRQTDFILRLMSAGDIPQRQAGEAAAAVQVGIKELHILDDAQMEAFILSPEKMAYKILTSEGKSKEEASALAKEITDRIIREGKKATFQEENLVSEASEYIEKGLKIGKKDNIISKGSKITGAIAKTLTFPFIKVPANIAWQSFKTINPQVALSQAIVQLSGAAHARSKGDMATFRRLSSDSKNNIAHAVIGLGFNAAAMYLINNGFVRPSNSSDTKKRESEGEKVFGKQNQVNFGRLMGGSDYWIDFSWFGVVGATIDTNAQLVQDKIDRKAKGEPEQSEWGDLADRMIYSTKASLNQLIFDQGARTMDALMNGGDKLKTLGVNTLNNVANVFTGATLTAISKATLENQARLKGDNFVDEIANNQKQRNILLRVAMNIYKKDSGEPPARISIWGEPIKNDRSFAGIAGTLLGGEKGNLDKFAVQIYNDAVKTGNIDFYPPSIANSVSVNGKPVKLTVDEQDKLDVFIGKNRKILVDALIKGNTSNGRYEDIPLDKRPKVLKDAYEIAREIGLSQFKLAFPQFNDVELTDSQIDKKLDWKEASDERKEVFKKLVDKDY